MRIDYSKTVHYCFHFKFHIIKKKIRPKVLYERHYRSNFIVKNISFIIQIIMEATSTMIR